MKNWFAGVFGLLAVAAMAAQAPAAVVLVTSTGNAATDASVESTLEAFGHAVTVGPQYFNLSGAGDFAGYEAVLLLANYNWQGGDMPAGAQSALVDFIGQGHGLVTGEWLVWKTADQQFATLRSAVPVQENDTVFRADCGPLAERRPTRLVRLCGRRHRRHGDVLRAQAGRHRLLRQRLPRQQLARVGRYRLGLWAGPCDQLLDAHGRQ